MKHTFTLVLALLPFLLNAKDYKGAEIYSNESFLYGKFEMKIKAAKGSGQLSTFFLYRNNSEQNSTLWEEIDIEIFGKNTSNFQTNVIIEKQEGKKLMTEEHHSLAFDLSEDFHTFIVEWTPDSISWYVDSQLIRTEKEYAKSCKHPMSIRFNHWAANIANWVGTFDTSALPAYQYVDYLTYYSYDSTATDPQSVFTLEWTDDFSSFNTSRWSKANWTFGENLCDFLPSNAYTEDGSLVLKLHDATPPTTGIYSNKNTAEHILSPNPFHFQPIIAEPYGAATTYSVANLQGQYLIKGADVEAVSDCLDGLPKGNYMLLWGTQHENKSSQIISKY